MKKTFFLLFATSFYTLLCAQEAIPVAPFLPAQEKTTPAEAPITVQYPQENMKVPRGAKNVYLFGQVRLPAPVTLEINGSTVPVHKNGGFIAFLPVETGSFPFVLTAASQGKIYQAVRHITVPGTDIKEFEKTAAFDPEEVFPQRPVALLPGDTLPLYVRGTPGAEVTAALPGLKGGKKIKLTESASQPGIYRASFIISPSQKPKEVKLIYRMQFAPSHSKAKITAPAKLSVWDKKTIKQALITAPGTKIRKLPTVQGNLYPHYRAYGQVQITGEKANQYRLVLNEQESAWLEKTNLKQTHSLITEDNLIQTLQMTVLNNKTRISFEGTRAVPIRIEEFKDRLELSLYYSQMPEENFSFDAGSPIVDYIHWAKTASNTVSFKIYFKPGQSLWGYGYDFDGTNLWVDLIHKPALSPTKQKPLAGARILIDAGHSPKRTPPYDGAVGPTGYLEYEATLALAMELKPKLEKLGATVILTRQGNNKMSLQARYQKALEENAHIFVSLHYNALPDTLNPLEKPRGYSIYYTYPHSFGLAQAVYQAYNRLAPVADNGLVHNDVLFIPRISPMPSILVENAFIILPEQEEMAQSVQGRAPFVQALYEGILKFYGITPPASKTTYLKAAPKPVLKAAPQKK